MSLHSASRMVACRGIAAMVLLHVIVACGEKSGDIVTGSLPANGPAVIIATSITSQSGMVGDAVIAPSVTVKNAAGVPLPGVAVAFTVTAGGGDLNGRTALTDGAGVASPQSWTLGSIAGFNEVTASVGSLPLVRFAATAVAGPPSVLLKITGDDEIAPPNARVAIPPRVYVTDRLGNSLAGQTVNFRIERGGGLLTGASAITDASGTAQLGSWTLGPADDQVVSANVGSLKPVLFNAQTGYTAPPCSLPRPIQSGTPIVSALTAANCPIAQGRVAEAFTFEATGAPFEMNVSSQSFDTYLEIRDAQGVLQASTDNVGASNNKARIQAFLPNGTYSVIVSSTKPNGLGAYTLSYAGASYDVTGCEPTFIARGVIVAHQRISASDCPFSTDMTADLYRLWMKAGTTITIGLRDESYDDHYYAISDGTGKVLGESKYVAPYEYALTFTAPSNGFYTIKVIGSPLGGVEYTLHM